MSTPQATSRREAVEAWQNGEFRRVSGDGQPCGIDAKIANWDERLSRVFNRGFWDGYYQGQKLGEWTHSYGNKATRKKVYAAKCTNFFKNLSVAEFVLEAVDAIEEGQECLITGETTGVYECTIHNMHDNKGEATSRVQKGQYFAIKTDRLIRRGDKLYLWQTEN